MSIELRRSSTSQRDFVALVEYFAAIDDDLARRFMKAVDETIQMIVDFPELGIPWKSMHPRFQGLRWRNVLGFGNYLIQYRVNRSDILITRIVDGRRDLDAIL